MNFPRLATIAWEEFVYASVGTLPMPMLLQKMSQLCQPLVTYTWMGRAHESFPCFHDVALMDHILYLVLLKHVIFWNLKKNSFNFFLVIYYSFFCCGTLVFCLCVFLCETF